MSKSQKIMLFGIIIPLIAFVAGLWVADGFSSTVSKSDSSSTAAPGESNSNQGRTLADQLSNAFENAANKVSPSVVPIFAEQEVEVSSPFGGPGDPFRDFFGDDFFKRFFGTPPGQGEEQKQTVRSMGSGVIITEDGYILTNNHVVQGADKLTVILQDEKKYSAKIIGTDPQSDVAVIKIDAHNLSVAALGDSDNLKVGQWVIAVGNPFQLLRTVTAGIISALGRSDIQLAAYEDFIQTDASINPGNSGGALADLDGQVVGINTAISSPSGGNVGIGFAIPIKMAQGIMDQLIAKGKVTRGYIGLRPQDIDENLAKAMKLKSSEGALVGDVVAGGPAEKAGLKRGDVITGFDGQPVKNSNQLRNMVAQMKPGSAVTLGVIRDGNEKKFKITLAERPAETAGGAPQSQTPHEKMSQKLGIGIQNLTPDIARQLGYENERGVLVADVKSGSAAEDAGLQRGDLIIEINQVTVTSVNEFNRETGKLNSGDSVALLVRRGQNTFFVALQVP